MARNVSSFGRIGAYFEHGLQSLGVFLATYGSGGSHGHWQRVHDAGTRPYRPPFPRYGELCPRNLQRPPDAISPLLLDFTASGLPPFSENFSHEGLFLASNQPGDPVGEDEAERRNHLWKTGIALLSADPRRANPLTCEVKPYTFKSNLKRLEGVDSVGGVNP